MTKTAARHASRDSLKAVLAARHHDPFEVLGLHREGSRVVVRAFVPGALEVLLDGRLPLVRWDDTDLFEWRGPAGEIEIPYRLRWRDGDGREHEGFDPYSFPPQIPDFDLHLFAEGRHRHPQRFLGANPWSVDGIEGVLFGVWAPNTRRVSVVGDFNRWDGRRHQMRVRGGSGVHELFVPGLEPGALYKFELSTAPGGALLVKSDPYGKAFERRPATASVVTGSDYRWGDGRWMEERARLDWLRAPLSIYEVHLGSWRRDEGLRAEDRFADYRTLAGELIPYVASLGFTHIELLPVMEHPLDSSWGYQTTGYFAPTRRHGDPDGLRVFIDECHRNGIGVILDWAPAHFPRDAHALARFDGTALYEHDDPRQGEHRDWGTLIFNYARNEVRSFLIASAVYWLEEFHADGLRVDAVASMLYLDYSRDPDDWVPNQHGGRENLAAMSFLRELNEVAHGSFPGAMVIAEESTAWPQVTRPTWVGGLGFSLKWNMGWMHDTLSYLDQDPIYRSYHHNNLTFGMLYAFSENFVLPLSHDEVVHGKRSLISRMPGDDWQRFANLRLLYTYMWTYPGKKLLFMGGEIGQWNEWDATREIDWTLLEHPAHRGLQALMGDLNRLYREKPALHEREFEPDGFCWIDCHDAWNSVVSFERRGGGSFVVVVLNFTPVPRHGYRIGVPVSGEYCELLNSDSAHYAGSDMGNAGRIRALDESCMGRPASVSLTLPPLAALVLESVGPAAEGGGRT